MTLIYLIRHGETDWNLNGRWQGQIDIPLNETGRQQASLLAAHLRQYRGLFGRLYSSDLGRAWDTAAIIGQALGQPPAALPGWRELDVGCWGGLTQAEQIALDPALYERFQAGEDVPYGGAERWSDLVARTRRGLDGISERHPRETVAIVTHGGPIRACLDHIAHLETPRRGPDLAVVNTSYSVLRRESGRWIVVSANNRPHLETVADTARLL
jgi:broad specificity phosphatase PhoE